MSKWITNWPQGEGGKWGACCAAMAVQIASEAGGGKCQVRLVESTYPIRRHILQTPRWAQTLAQRSPAVALALSLMNKNTEGRRQKAEAGAR